MISPDPTSVGGAQVAPSPAREASSSASLGAKISAGALVLALSFLGGTAAWLAGEYFLNFYKASRAASENYRDPTALNLEMPGVNSRNGALAFGSLGGLLGLCLGLAGGISRRSVGGALLGAIAGVILGVTCGAFPSFAVMPWQWTHRGDDPWTADLLAPMLIHFGLWSGAGFAAGLAFAIGSRGFNPFRLFQGAFAGLVGAMLGTLVYELGGAYLFPFAHTPNPFSDTAVTRLLARLCVAGFVGLAVFRTLRADLPRKKASPGVELP
jgi:hypothetical protein